MSRSDPLLTAARWLVRIIQALMLIAAAAIVLALPLILFNQAEVQRQLAEQNATLDAAGLLIRLMPLLLAALMFVAIVYQFARRVALIIDTVAQGDPFVPVNAVRLTQMAWLAVLGQVIAWAVALLAIWVSSAFPREPVSIEAEFSLNGLILVVLLFILARVFRHGAAMRADLEGTV